MIVLHLVVAIRRKDFKERTTDTVVLMYVEAVAIWTANGFILQQLT